MLSRKGYSAPFRGQCHVPHEVGLSNSSNVFEIRSHVPAGFKLTTVMQGLASQLPRLGVLTPFEKQGTNDQLLATKLNENQFYIC